VVLRPLAGGVETLWRHRTDLRAGRGDRVGVGARRLPCCPTHVGVAGDHRRWWEGRGGGGAAVSDDALAAAAAVVEAAVT